MASMRKSAKRLCNYSFASCAKERFNDNFNTFKTTTETQSSQKKQKRSPRYMQMSTDKVINQANSISVFHLR